MNFWLIKSPFKAHRWDSIFLRGSFKLFGIRSRQARNNIAEMKPGDLALFYHSQSNKSILGVMKVKAEPYPDPTSAGDWLAVDFEPVKTFENPVILQQIKENDKLNNTAIIKQPRLSVVKLAENEYQEIFKLAEI